MHFDILKLSRRVPHPAVAAAGLVLLLAMQTIHGWLGRQVLEAQRQIEVVQEAADDAAIELEQALSLRDLKQQDLDRFKAGLPGAAQSRRALYEAGLALQEEKRLLEKQWEIVSTYLLVDEAERKIHVMRGDQSLESYPLLYDGPTILGNETRPLPVVTAIVSKERFAHPERGKSEEIDGKLEWTPPQVGTSVRANALGEYVIFTRSPLILHGPPKHEAEHRLFPHICLGLSLRAAKNLYKESYIGTNIYIRMTSPQKAPSEEFLDSEPTRAKPGGQNSLVISNQSSRSNGGPKSKDSKKK